METPTYDYNYYLNKGFRILRKNYISNYIEFLLKSDESHNQWVRFENCSSAERMDLRFS